VSRERLDCPSDRGNCESGHRSGHRQFARRLCEETPPSPMATTTAVRCAVRMLYTSLWLELSGPGKCCSRRSCRMVYPDTARKRHNVGRP
jgi:hypothetical protein